MFYRCYIVVKYRLLIGYTLLKQQLIRNIIVINDIKRCIHSFAIKQKKATEKPSSITFF